jgi:hypothetical protein
LGLDLGYGWGCGQAGLDSVGARGHAGRQLRLVRLDIPVRGARARGRAGRLLPEPPLPLPVARSGHAAPALHAAVALQLPARRLHARRHSRHSRHLRHLIHATRAALLHA